MSHPLRDYQSEDVDSVHRELALHRATLYEAATGLGKTRVMTEVAHNMLPARTILLAHRGELIWQARDAFRHRGMEVEIEKANLTASEGLFSRAPVVLATVQTMITGKEGFKRMTRFNPMDFGLLLYDESHHSVSPGNIKIVKHFMDGNPNLKVLGVTATPMRADEVAMGKIFQSVAARRDLRFGIDNGWLVEPHVLMPHVGALDFSHVRPTSEDLNLSDLSAVMESERAVAGLAMPTLEAVFGMPINTLLPIDPKDWRFKLLLAGRPRRTLVFTVSVPQAEKLSNIFNRIVPGISRWLCGKTLGSERAEIFRDFSNGRCAILVNCGVTIEGYDNPGIEIIANGRPTRSLSLLMQIIGRGTRTLKGLLDGLSTPQERLEAIAKSDKPRVTILDFAGNNGKLKFVTTADILAGNMSDQAVKNAVERAKESTVPVKIADVMAEEEALILQKALQKKIDDEAMRAKLVAKVKYSVTTVNPFDVMDIDPVRQRKADRKRPLSEGQVKTLLQHEISPHGMTYEQGSKLVREIFRRLRNQLCTPGQSALLTPHGYKTSEMTKKEASKLIDGLKKNGWRRPDFGDVAKGIQ